MSQIEGFEGLLRGTSADLPAALQLQHTDTHRTLVFRFHHWPRFIQILQTDPPSAQIWGTGDHAWTDLSMTPVNRPVNDSQTRCVSVWSTLFHPFLPVDISSPLNIYPKQTQGVRLGGFSGAGAGLAPLSCPHTPATGHSCSRLTPPLTPPVTASLRGAVRGRGGEPSGAAVRARPSRVHLMSGSMSWGAGLRTQRANANKATPPPHAAKPRRWPTERRYTAAADTRGPAGTLTPAGGARITCTEGRRHVWSRNSCLQPSWHLRYSQWGNSRQQQRGWGWPARWFPPRRPLRHQPTPEVRHRDGSR